ncbi:hypothetical protein CH330_08135 [candidate division WOR-3 bacterium JGI_Cruoil_03_51_56]|uniref:PDZ domain-containing protein n=1 Tax=candidate division WOR-3 bacterium JGI_Cruoil_03_51_56 TaxID=1973747 RepID=A0A235BRF3_UNCW3|nr:MAG: hypothetical protein CH330_08135 [candidate division WOR-3 bacterium JGI_Cruoil_03_51_56]
MKKSRILWLVPLVFLSFVLAGQKTETVKRGWLGVFSNNLSQPMLIALNIDNGVLVSEVIDSSPADQAGLASGDVILELDGEQITDGSDLRYVVRKRPGKKINMLIRRRGKPKRMHVTLGAREPGGWWQEGRWPQISGETYRAAQKAFRRIGSKVEKYVMPLDSLRKELDELKQELNELKQKVREGTKGK